MALFADGACYKIAKRALSISQEDNRCKQGNKNPFLLLLLVMNQQNQAGLY
jgi:hypothetical protein